MTVESSLLDRNAAAQYIGVSKKTFITKVSKELPHLARGRRHLYRREDLDDWIRLNLSQPNPAA